MNPWLKSNNKDWSPRVDK